jgi:hypothetical protein
MGKIISIADSIALTTMPPVIAPLSNIKLPQSK